MKRRLIPFVTISLAAAFAAAPAFAQPRSATGAGLMSLQSQQDDPKPPEKPPAKPPQDEKPPKPADNPPAHVPDSKPPEKPVKPAEPPRQENPSNVEKPPKPEKQNKTAQNQENNKKSVHAQANVHYSFRSQDKTTLKQHFDSQLRSVNRSNRPSIRVGGFIPAESVTLIQPVPVEVITLLPPVPEGCVVGFWDGFIIVYYPDDFYIVTYVDLL
jgi:outer membrane biosynthesis protein TonB